MKNAHQYQGAWRPKKFFAIRKPISKDVELYVSAGLLDDRFGVKMKTIRNGVSKFTQQQSTYWKSFRDGNAIMIDYDSIPGNTKMRSRLPKNAKDTLEILRSEMILQEDIHQDAEILHLRQTFEEAYHNHWPLFLKFYLSKVDDQKERIRYAKSHALLEVIVNATNKKWSSKIIFSEYSAIIKGEIDALDEPKFKTLSQIYFWRVVRRCRQDGIPQTLIHDSLGVSKEYLVKMTGPIKAFIRLELRKPQNLLIRDIIKNVIKKYNVELSPSSIKSFKTKNGDRNVFEYDSNGKVHSRQNGLPKITRFLAEGPGEQYQGDFYKLQFYCRNITGKVVRLWAYVVLDVFSKKVVGWALSENQSATLAKNAFKMAFVDNCFLPEEIIIDNDTFYNKKIFKRFIRRVNNLGVITTKSYPNIPTWKAEIESFFGVFQKLHSAKPWYMGEGVKSKNIAGNPSEEFTKKLYTQVSKMLSVSEMITEFDKMVKEYNQATNNRKKKVAPTDYFRMYNSRRTIKWEDWMEALLFWKAKTKKRIKDDGRIDLQIEGVEYCYQVTQAEMLWSYKNSDVRMCYNPRDLSRLYIFERGTLKHIGKIEPRMVMTRENKTEVLRTQKRILKDAQQYLREKRDEDEALVSGIKGVVVRAETLDDKIIKRQMKRERFEKQVAKVPIHQ